MSVCTFIPKGKGKVLSYYQFATDLFQMVENCIARHLLFRSFANHGTSLMEALCTFSSGMRIPRPCLAHLGLRAGDASPAPELCPKGVGIQHRPHRRELGRGRKTLRSSSKSTLDLLTFDCSQVEASERVAAFAKESWTNYISQFDTSTFQDRQLARRIELLKVLGVPALPEEKLQEVTYIC